jgi:hypothetical protein
MAKNTNSGSKSSGTGKWQITHDHSGKSVTFNTRQEAAAYAWVTQQQGAYDLEVTTPDGRTGMLGSTDGVVKPRWVH